MADRISILSTKIIDDSCISELADEGIDIDVMPLLSLQYVENIEIQQEIQQAALLQATVVFTSTNAVESVGSYLEFQPEWNIYCLEHATKESVESNFGESVIAGTAENASDLAELIIESGVEEIIFFCGNNRRHELPARLREHEIDVNEIIVYETVGLPQKINRHYNGIMFFSPLAVSTFFSSNQIESQVVLFAIGETTAKEIAHHCNNIIIVSSAPHRQQMISELKDFFINNTGRDHD